MLLSCRFFFVRLVWLAKTKETNERRKKKQKSKKLRKKWAKSATDSHLTTEIIRTHTRVCFPCNWFVVKVVFLRSEHKKDCCCRLLFTAVSMDRFRCWICLLCVVFVQMKFQFLRARSISFLRQMDFND